MAKRTESTAVATDLDADTIFETLQGVDRKVVAGDVEGLGALDPSCLGAATFTSNALAGAQYSAWVVVWEDEGRRRVEFRAVGDGPVWRFMCVVSGQGNDTFKMSKSRRYVERLTAALRERDPSLTKSA